LYQQNNLVIDTNILAPWILEKGNILDLICSHYGLSSEFKEVYANRYASPISFIDEIISKKSDGLDDEFFISHLAMNELFSAIRDELRSIILFNNGTPISRWRDARLDPDIPEKFARAMYTKILETFDPLFGDGALYLIKEGATEYAENYWSIYSSMLFLIKEIKTQDTMLLTTAILYEADYFVTRDERLIKAARNRLLEQYNLQLIKPEGALALLKKKAR
jgi:predicted nucleic acid-binding protein